MVGLARSASAPSCSGPADSDQPRLIVASSAAPPHPPPGPAGAGPLVTFARSSLAVRFGTRCRTLLELAEACDIPTRWSCRSGICHTCITPLLDGHVTYDPEIPSNPPPRRS